MPSWSSAAQHGARRPAAWLTVWAARPLALVVVVNVALLPGVLAAQPASARKSSLKLRGPASSEDLRKARTALAEKTQEMEAQSAQLLAERKRSALLAREVEQLSQKLKVEENKEFVLQRKLSKVQSDLLTDLEMPGNASTAGDKVAASVAAKAEPKTLAQTTLTPRAAAVKKAAPGTAKALEARKIGLIDARAGNAGAASVRVSSTRASKAIAAKTGAGRVGLGDATAIKTAADDAGSENAGGTAFDRLEEKLHEEDERIQAMDSESIPEGSEGAADEERIPESSLEGATAGTDESSQPAPESVEPTQQASFVQTPLAASSPSPPSSPESSDALDTPEAASDAQADAQALESGSSELVPLEAEEAGPDALPAELKSGEASESVPSQDSTGEALGDAGMNSQAVDVANQAAEGASGNDDIKSVLDTTVSSDDQAFLSEVAPGAADASGSA
mmetsp:Transcript_156889/g.273068  ORF Transcript_156889/g.273068 Transcript_156889/m.273068 type:complete len:450 (-) Transcript_156889:82-1431(-)